MNFLRITLLIVVLLFVGTIAGCQEFAKPGTVNMDDINNSFYGPYEMDYE